MKQHLSLVTVAFDKISLRTLMALRLLTAYKCDHQGKGFSMAKGLRSAFKSYFEMYIPVCFSCFCQLTHAFRVHGCQGEFWRFDPARQKWEGNPVFDPT